MTQQPRGQIYSEEAYAHSKMLDNSGWLNAEKYGNRILPRRITPSDIDVAIGGSEKIVPFPLVFDNSGKLLFCELSRLNDEWKSLTRGQRLVYEACIRMTAHCSVLCYHNVAPESGKKIDTREDIVRFQVMVDDFGLVYSKVVEGNQAWQHFVFWWFRDPQKIRRILLGRSAGLVQA